MLTEFNTSTPSIDDASFLKEKIEPLPVLPCEIYLQFFKNLNGEDLEKCSVVSKSWNEMTKDSVFLQALIKEVSKQYELCFFGKDEYKEYLGKNVKNIPPFPVNILKILNSPCPFWTGKKVRETHSLFLISKDVPLNILSELVKAKGKMTLPPFSQKNRKSPEKSYWALITKDIIPSTKGVQYEKAEKDIKDKGYRILNLLEAYIAEIANFSKTEKSFFDKTIYTITIDEPISLNQTNQSSLICGKDASAGFSSNDRHTLGEITQTHGIVGVRILKNPQEFSLKIKSSENS